MKLIHGLPGEPPPWPYPVLTVGNFDGVHLGHQLILNTVVQRARGKSGTAVMLTFDPHPQEVLAPGSTPHMLSSFRQRARWIELLGFDYLVRIPFTRHFSRQTPSEFVERVLHDALKAEEIYVGSNFTFGHRRAGTSRDLESIGKSLGIHVHLVGPVQMDGGIVSSSTIRKLLLDGQIRQANSLLGRPYEVEGQVIGGQQRGRTMGYPTANLELPGTLIPPSGVYAVKVHVKDETPEDAPVPAVGYIGSRPTFGGGESSIEIHLLDYEGELYQHHLRVSFLERIRDEMKFPSPEALCHQIEQDVNQALKIHEGCGQL